MSFSRKRQETADIIESRCLETLEELMSKGVKDWPLPTPPLIDSELPVLDSQSSDKICEQAAGLFAVNRALFNSLLSDCRESMIPHRLSLTADPDREGERWLLKRIDDVIKQILFGFCEHWLASALDRSAPNATRWFIGIALFNGLCHQNDGVSENRGYHILESVAMSKPPGNWPTRAESGRHQIDWIPNKSSAITLQDDSGGIDAIHWLFDALEKGNEERQILLAKWMRIMLERPVLVEKMALATRFEQMIDSQPNNVAAEIVSSVPRLLEVSNAAGLVLLSKLQTRDDGLINGALSDILPALLRTSLEDGLALLDHLASSEEIGARSAATGALKELAQIDSTAFLNRITKPATDPERGVRRIFIQACVRDYLELDPSDSMGILVPLWIEDDEVAGIRLRELLLRMQDIDPASFSLLGKKLIESSSESIEKFYKVLEIRNSERANVWKNHFTDGGAIPEPLI
ncbi:MAG: hypothetical protein HOE69_06950 [Euryarchaeota archaeon]|jgi:hypothetical protein|nr:hypothetical protein [Euryarchaeota archaeon]